MEKDKQYENDYKEFAALLNKYGVDYLIVGAYAIIYHTKISCNTKDIDFWIRKTKENAQKCVQAIKEFCGIDIKKEDLLENKKIFFIGVEPYRLDIFNEQGPLNFDKAWKKKVKGKFRNVDVYFISRKDLLTVKKHFKRDKDIRDIKNLSKN